MLMVAQAFLFCYLLRTTLADDDHGKDVLVYTSENFSEEVPLNNHFIMFYAPWCGHCKRLAPTWNELAHVYNVDGTDCTIAKVDCTEQTALCAENKVSGYPTLKFFSQDTPESEQYRGQRDLDSLKDFVEEQLSKEAEDDVKLPEAKAPSDGKLKDPVAELDSDIFTKHIATGSHFVKFYAPWCGHCKQLAPIWEELGKAFKDDDSVFISKVDCTAQRSICDQFEVRGYPTLNWIRDGLKIEKYQGGRTLENLKEYASKMSKVKAENTERTDEKVPEERRELEPAVVDLDAETFEDKTDTGLFFIKFFAPWCGHCKRLAPIWEELAQNIKDKDISIAKVDCTKYHDLCKKFEVKGYPTLIMVRNGIKLEDYRGGRDVNSLTQFVETFIDIITDEDEDKHDEL